MTETLRIEALMIYPVKSCAGIALERAELDAFGLAGDRRWMLTDASGAFVNQLAQPRLSLIQASSTAKGIELRAPGMQTLNVSSGQREAAHSVHIMYKREVSAARVSEAASRWFTEFLGSPHELVALTDDIERRVKPKYTRAHAGAGALHDRVGFADDFPHLLATVESLQHLNHVLDAPVDMRRFRPNIVVSGGEAFAEDGWRVLRAESGVELLFGKPCVRCAMITVDPDEGARRGPEPTRSLARLHTLEAGVCFGVLMTHRGVGALEVGEMLEVVE